MNDFQLKTSKAEIFKSMMKRPETAKLIKEALNSPLGSTSRVKAKKVFSIMNKLNSSHDGSGGPGMMYDQMTYGQQGYPTVPQTPQPSIPKPMVIFHKIPKPSITYGKKAAPQTPKVTQFDGIGGKGIHDGAGGFFSNLFSNFNNNSTPAPIFNPNQSLVPSSGINTNGIDFSKMGLTLNNPTPNTSGFVGNNQSSPNAMFQNNSTVNNGVVVPNKPQTLNTNPNQSMVNSPVPNYTPEGIAKTQNMGLYVPQTPVANATPVSSMLSGAKNQPPVSSSSPYVMDANGHIVWEYDTKGNPLRPMDKSTYEAQNEKKRQEAEAAKAKKVLDDAKIAEEAKNKQITDTTKTNVFSSITDPLKSAATSAADVAGNAATTTFDSLKNSIMTQENGQYTEVNKDSGALGKYQIMPFNLGYAGLQNTPEDIKKFLASPELQDRAFTAMMQDLNTKYNGDPAKIAAAYYGGGGGAMKVGTAAGDVKQGDYPSINEYVASVLKRAGASTTTGETSVDSAIKANLGPKTFALGEYNAENQGKTIAQQMHDNEDALFKKYNIEDLTKKKADLEKEKEYLPEDVTDWIKSRDQYLAETDRNIKDLIDESRSNSDMSDPLAVKQLNSQLNYLYTLRARQNQSYVGFLNKSVEEQQRKLDAVTSELTTNLALYEREVTSDNTMMQSDFTNKTDALADMYTTLEAAPTKALQLKAYESQVNGTDAQSIKDAIDLSTKNGYIAQGEKLKDYTWDKNYLAKLDTNLMDVIYKFQTLDPTIKPVNIIQTYVDGVSKYMNTPNEKDEVTGTGVTSSGKKKLAEQAITNFAQFAIQGSINKDDGSMLQGINEAYKAGGYLTNQLAPSLTGKASQIREAIKSLAPTNLFGSAKASPTEEEFVKTFTSKTGDSSAESANIARSIYAQFNAYRQSDPSNLMAPKDAVFTMLNKTSSTSNRTNATPFTDDELGTSVAKMYSDLLVQSNLAQISADMERLLGAQG